MLVAHATVDLSPNDIGFIHGIALAAAQSGERELLTLHSYEGGPVFDPVGPALWLTRWGLPGDHIKQRFVPCSGYDDVAEALLAACRSARPDLLILPTHERSGVSRLFMGSVAEAVARNLSIPCLLLPLNGRRFVEQQTGKVTLERMLVLGGTPTDAQLGVDSAAWFARGIGIADAQATMLHVFDRTQFPETTQPPELRLRVQHRAGELNDVVTMVCAEQQPQLIVMVSHGHDQLRDVLFANRTERVLRAAHRPLLWVPATFNPR
ncbi:MAG TPA: universal stress protein [Polyangiales bacterium]|nr:universal stress protein [Polyangiales bacterium]